VKPKKDEEKLIWRLGVAYRSEIGNWSIAPEFNIDFTEGERGYVFGVGFGYGF